MTKYRVWFSERKALENKFEIIFIILELIMNSYEIYQANKKLKAIASLIFSERRYKVR